MHSLLCFPEGVELQRGTEGQEVHGSFHGLSPLSSQTSVWQLVLAKACIFVLGLPQTRHSATLVYVERPLQVAPQLADVYQSTTLAGHAASATADGAVEGVGGDNGGVPHREQAAYLQPLRPVMHQQSLPLPPPPNAVMTRLTALEHTGTRPPAGTLLIVHNLSGPSRWRNLPGCHCLLPPRVRVGPSYDVLSFSVAVHVGVSCIAMCCVRLNLIYDILQL